MARMEFDTFKNNYRAQLEKSLSLVGVGGQSADFVTEVKANLLLEIAAENFPELSKLRVLDVGCGIGLTDRFLVGKFGSVAGVDVAPGVIEVAKSDGGLAEYMLYDGVRLPYPDGHFDIAFTICVLHHVESEHRARFVAEMRRVTKQGGLCLIFEHNPYNPLTLYVVNRCPFDEDAVLLRAKQSRNLFSEAGLEILEHRYFLFFPWRGKAFEALGRILKSLPLGAQYMVVGRV